MTPGINIILSIGSNTNHEQQMSNAKEKLSRQFPGMTFSDALLSPACGMSADAAPYSNILAKASTTHSEETVRSILKTIERELGDTPGNRSRDIVLMDIDLLEYDGNRRHASDWQRPYVRQLLPTLRTLALLLCLTLPAYLPALSQTVTRSKDTETLGKAMEYFQGGKYHEAILHFEQLQRHYKLNPRFRAYLGMSYYKEQQYEEAAENLMQGIPQLTPLSPSEQAVYIYTCAESLFRMERYDEAIEYYTMALPLTEGNDRGDVLFHTAFAHYIRQDTSTAIPLFRKALELYRRNTSAADALHTARKRQTEIMLRGLTSHDTPLPDEEPPQPSSDNVKP